MPLTDFQRTKLARMFDVYDTNGDGRVEQQDFTRRAHQFAQQRGWTEESPDFREQLDFTLADWYNLQQADEDGDGAVTREEFLSFADLMLADPDALEQYAYKDADLIFRAMDADNDGRITANEYEQYLRVYDLEGENAHYFFRMIDNDSDGFVTRDEITRALKEFLFSDDASAPGNFLYGRLDERLIRK